jgi:hypothetical protein
MITLDHDIVFSTYTDDIPKLEEFKKHLQPKACHLTPRLPSQNHNFKHTLPLLDYQNYDYIVFLRFEAIYKIPLSEWEFQGKTGLILPFKEYSKEMFDREGFYNDNIIIVSTSVYQDFMNAVVKSEHYYCATLHNLATNVRNIAPHIQVHCLVEGYYQSNSDNHPFIEAIVCPLYILVHHKYFAKDAERFGLPLLFKG